MGLIFSSSLPFHIIAAVFVATAYAQTTAPNICDARVSLVSPCHLSVFVNQQCQSAILHFPGTNFTNSCFSVQIFWNYPMNNLTLFIDTPFTATPQSYALQLNARSLKPHISSLYRVQPNGVTTELQFQSPTITVRSDSSFQVGLEFVGPRRFLVYGVFIRYDVIRT